MCLDVFRCGFLHRNRCALARPNVPWDNLRSSRSDRTRPRRRAANFEAVARARPNLPGRRAARHGRLVMRVRSLPAVVGAVLLALGALLPRPAHTTDEEPPAIDLGRIRVSGGQVVAPTLDGGTATLTLVPEVQKGATRLLA